MQKNIFKNYSKSGLNHKMLSLSRWNTIIFLIEDPFKQCWELLSPIQVLKNKTKVIRANLWIFILILETHFIFVTFQFWWHFSWVTFQFWWHNRFSNQDIDDMRNVSGLLTLNKIGDTFVLMIIQFLCHLNFYNISVLWNFSFGRFLISLLAIFDHFWPFWFIWDHFGSILKQSWVFWTILEHLG